MSEYEKDNHEFDKSGQYDAGLKSLVRSLQLAFAFLLVLIIGMVIYFFSFGGYFAVKPQEAVIVLRFGQYYQTYQSDWHWFMPYPVSEFIQVRVSPQFMDVGFTADTMVLADGQEQGRPLEPGRDGYLITGDANIIHAAWNLSYTIIDPKRYYEKLLTPSNPLDPDQVEKDERGYAGTRGAQTLIENTFRQAVQLVTSCQTVDILYNRQSEYREEVQREFTKLIDALDCGIAVSSVALKQISPPLKTKSAFDEVAAASNVQSALKTQAEEYQVKISNEAKAREAEIIAQAEIYRKQIVSEVKAESQYFTSINKAYQENPKTVLMALYNSTLADVLENQENKFILGTQTRGERKQIRLKINPEPPVPAKPAQPEGE
jgi:regulator of protease activity HflC (stomatin/prohibitin superfamily)